MQLENLAKWLVLIGLAIIVVGGLLWLGGKMGLGQLPGDIRVHKEKWGIYFPIATSIILSIVLTIVINLILWLFRK